MVQVVLRWAEGPPFWSQHAEAGALGFNLPMERTDAGEWVLSDPSIKGAGGLPAMRRRENIWFVNYLPVNGEAMLVALLSADLAEAD